MARDVEQFYCGQRAPLSEVTAAIYGGEVLNAGESEERGGAATQ